MKCTNCHATESKVIDKRNNRENNAIRRRRECLSCGTRYTTYERIENSGLLIRKKSGKIEEFDRQKLKTSVLKGLKKRHVTEDEINKFIDKIEIAIAAKRKPIIESNDIGAIVLEGLKDVDKVAYLLYATVYRDFEDIEEIEKAIKKLKNN
jgi:transcriptional repressor NrdR